MTIRISTDNGATYTEVPGLIVSVSAVTGISRSPDTPFNVVTTFGVDHELTGPNSISVGLTNSDGVLESEVVFRDCNYGELSKM